MSEQQPAGWYPDAGVPDQLRWFDGTAWTPHVVAKAPAAPVAPAVGVPTVPAEVPAATLGVLPPPAARPTYMPAPLPAAAPRPVIVSGTAPLPDAVLTPAEAVMAAPAPGSGGVGVMTRPAAPAPSGQPPPRPVRDFHDDPLHAQWDAGAALTPLSGDDAPPSGRGFRRAGPFSRWALASVVFTVVVPAVVYLLARADVLDSLPAAATAALWATPVLGVVAAVIGIASTGRGGKRGRLMSVMSLMAGVATTAMVVVGVAVPAYDLSRKQGHDATVRKDLVKAAAALESVRTTTGRYPTRGTLPIARSESATALQVCFYRDRAKVLQYTILGANPEGSVTLAFDSKAQGVLTTSARLPVPFTAAVVACPAGTRTGPTG